MPSEADLQAELPADLFQPAASEHGHLAKTLGEDELLEQFFLTGNGPGDDPSHLCKELSDALETEITPPLPRRQRTVQPPQPSCVQNL